MADNSVTLTGTLGADPVRRSTTKGEVTTFSLAHSPRIKTDDGWTDGQTSWFDVSVWGTLGAHALASLRRGQRAIVHGVVSVGEYDRKDGSKGRGMQIKATAVGHDLAFGTTQFTKSSGPRPHEQAPQPAPRRALAAVGGGVGASGADSAAEPSEPSDWGTSFGGPEGGAGDDLTPF